VDATQHIPPVDPDDPMVSTIRTAPVRPGPIGPQGTRSISRDGYGAAVPMGGVGTVAPYGPPNVPPGQRRRTTIANSYQSQRHRGRRTMVIWISVVLVLAAVLGVAAWWFGSGRWTAVPRIGGLDPTAAEQTLQNADLSAALTQAHDNTVPAGRVVGTSPSIGSRALRGSTVTVVISEGRPIVPDITPGASPDAVEVAVRAAQLTPRLDPNQDAFDNTVPKGAVVRLNPAPGTQVNIGAVVVLVISKGPAPRPVPNVVGQPHDQAFAALTQAGFQPFDEPQTFDGQTPGGTVVATTPGAGTVIQPGTSLKVGVQTSNAVTVPTLTGQSAQQAQQTLQGLGLQVQIQAVANDPNGQVFVQSPGPGTLVQPGSTVTLGVFP
jgi:serine/threonine-protein kinase